VYHFVIEISVTRQTVEVIRREFEEFIEKGGGFSINIATDSGFEGSPELSGAIKEMLIELLVAVSMDRFEGIN